MFTGIVSGLGRVLVVPRPSGGRIGIEHAATARRLQVGGSVAVNGACLTVVELEDAAFFAEVVPETLRRTNLGSLEAGAVVNLEPALAAGDALDGHLVQGHVDATAKVLEVHQADLGREVVVGLPPAISRLVAEKGSIAIDGTSLTVSDVDHPPDTFRVALIPHTLSATLAGGYQPGTVVNLEVDVVARYVARLVPARTGESLEGAQ